MLYRKQVYFSPVTLLRLTVSQYNITLYRGRDGSATNRPTRFSFMYYILYIYIYNTREDDFRSVLFENINFMSFHRFRFESPMIYYIFLRVYANSELKSIGVFIKNV